MTKIITAPEDINVPGFTVYLGGAIDMGEAVNWQAEVINTLKDNLNLVLLNPRRAKFTKDTLDEQITWELHAMDTANVIIMWFPKEAEAPISFFETGLYLKSGKLILGVEKGFFRQRNLELTCKHYSVNLYYNLKEMTEEVLRRFTR